MLVLITNEGLNSTPFSQDTSDDRYDSYRSEARSKRARFPISNVEQVQFIDALHQN